MTIDIGMGRTLKQARRRREDGWGQPSGENHNDDVATTAIGDTDRSEKDAGRSNEGRRSDEGMRVARAQADGHMEDRAWNAGINNATEGEAIGERRSSISLNNDNTRT